ncbi:peroxiredoxin 2 family [Fusarium heterosporum]|uniref:Peroxiredoxin 2 family n=1 Tax=Fusarium heterosporum TaxID=42747 RepID=A0A8H5T3E2_FUSHE|nr:peroxiredoxin 2 family [Fusarium heterosporum]
MTDNHTEANASVPVKSPIERKPVGGIQLENASAEQTQSLPQQPVQDSTENTTEATSLDTSSVPRKAASSRSKSPPSPIKIDKTQPEDFEGELATNNDIPSAATLKKIEKYIVLDRHGKSHPFKTLYTGSNVARRVLIIFVRHFFCGNCQEFLRSLSEAVTPEALLRLPVSTFIAVIGCGDPALIDMYVNETGCRFPVYTDPTRSIFDALGMSKTLQMGSKPAYMRRSMMHSIVGSIVQGVKQIPSGNVLKMGDQRQVGGEFLFEPRDILTPLSTPRNEQAQPISAFEEAEEKEVEQDGYGNEEKRVTWCHRMKTTRDHAEIPELIEVLGLDQTPATGSDVNRGSVTSARKGKGRSMAQEIRKMSLERSRTSNET